MKKNEERVNIAFLDAKTRKNKYIESRLMTHDDDRTILHESIVIKKGELVSFPSLARTKDEVKDLYYLDELIKDMHKRGVLHWGELYMTFLHDWYTELKGRVGHTDVERAKYLKKNWGGMDRGWVKEHFMSTEERNKFLEHDL